MIWAVVISVVLFTLGNVFWSFIGDPKAYYIPQAVMIFILMVNARVNLHSRKQWENDILNWCLLLAGSNVIKQLFYDKKLYLITGSLTIPFVMDCIGGSMITIFTIIQIYRHGRPKSNSYQ